MKNLIALIVFLLSPLAHAYEWSFVGRVTTTEPTYAPNMIAFQSTTGIGNCPAGIWLWFHTSGATVAEKVANYDAVYKTLVTAQVTNRPVRLYGNNSGCAIQHIHLL